MQLPAEERKSAMTHLLTRDSFVPFARRRGMNAGSMPVNVYETETGIAIDATLPGFDKDDIEVTVDAGRLRIRAEHNVETCEDSAHDHADRRYRYREVFRRTAERSFEIGDRFDAAAIQAELDKGVLHLELPRSEAERAQKIQINGN